MNTRRVLSMISIFLSLSFIVFGQTFNVSPKGYVGGMPGGEYNDVWGYVGSDGKEYAIIGSRGAINIFDVSNCSNPILAFQYIDGGQAIWRDFKTYQGYAYAVCDNTAGSICKEGLQIINLDTYSVTQDSSEFKSAHNLWVDEVQGRLYVAGSNASGGSNLLIYTLDTEVVNGTTYAGTPANPILLKKHFTFYVHDMFARNHLVYASQGYNGYRLWNTTNPLSPVEIANNLDGTGYNHSSYVTPDGTTAYGCEEVPRGRPIKIYQITGSGVSTAINNSIVFTDPCEAPTYTNPRPHNPFIKGDTLFIAYYEDGVQMWDISNKLSPKRIAYYDTYRGQNGIGYNNSSHDWKGAWGVYPYLPSGCIIVGDITQGLFTFKNNIPPPAVNTIDKMTKVGVGDLIFDNNTKGIVLRSPEGYCFRLIVSNTGVVSTQQIICDINGSKVTKIYQSDLGFVNTKGVVLKSNNNTCYRIKISGLSITTETANCGLTTNNIKTTDGDVIIETATKGIVLSNGTTCYRIMVSDTGVLSAMPLIECE